MDLNREYDRVNGVRSLDVFDVIVAESATIHPTSIIGGTAEWVGKETRYPVRVGAHTTIRPFCTVDAGVERDTVISDNVLLMTRVHVGHDSQIGAGTQIAPGAVVCGCVTIGENVKIGVNASIRPHVIVGDGARIGAGAVVVKDVPPGEVWVGNPARRMSR